MNAFQGQVTGEVVSDASEFFAPMSSDLVDSLLGQYSSAHKRIKSLAEAVSAEACSSVLHYFIEGNLRDERYGVPSKVAQLFDVGGAVAQLNADYWSRALSLTDVMDYMPQARRDQWHEQIRNPQGKKKHRSETEWELEPLPAFEESSVRSTLEHLLSSRAKFLAERVDGIFRSLSRQHVTNQPQGFSKRMIIAGVFSYGTAGQINDLRCVIAKFMGRDEPKHGATDPVIKAARRNNGQWTNVDGGALRIRVYGGVGTAHLEVHPDMAWRLNGILASLYPAAIPAEFREKPKRAKKIKDFELFDKPLPFAVIGRLANMERGWKRVTHGFREGREYLTNTLCFGFSGDTDKASLKQAEDVLSAIGGVFVPTDKESGIYAHWAFNYDPKEVIDQIVCSGSIPDQKSHQFYPTPVDVAAKAVEKAMASATPNMIWLEPSAGIGGLADLMPKERLQCVEISPLHCKILKSKGYSVEEADFLKLPVNGPFDRIVMNPPFSEGRWQAHVQHAALMLKDDGVLVAILPASAKGKHLLEGFDHDWSAVLDNKFSGTSVSVVILTAVRKQ